MPQAGRFFPSGHRDVPVRSTIIARSASGVFSKLDRSVERDCVFDAHFPRFSRKDHHQPTSSRSIAFKNPTIPTLERCDFVTRCGSATTAAVATDTARCKDRIPNRLIAWQSFLGVRGWGWGANVLSYFPNLAHCAVQTSSMQHRGFATQWSEARLAPRGHVTPKLHEE